MTYAEAAAAVGRAVKTVQKWARVGLIARYRRPLDKRVFVRLSEIIALLEAEPELIDEYDDEDDEDDEDGGGATR